MKATFTFAFIFTHSLSNSRSFSENFRFVKDTQRLPKQDSQLRNSSYRVSHYQVVNLKLIFDISPYLSFLAILKRMTWSLLARPQLRSLNKVLQLVEKKLYKVPQTASIIEMAFCNSVISLYC